jgi:hypothetical protein
MQQRRLRLGDILDDYCPRERRITNHAIVAIIGDEVKQTRCTTCDADHEYKQARVPPPRRKKDALHPSMSPTDVHSVEPEPQDESEQSLNGDEIPVEAASIEEQPEPLPIEDEDRGEDSREEDGPVHRRLIRATLPRPEGQPPDRKNPEFTIRQPGSRGRDFNGNRTGGGGQRHGRGRRAARGPQNSFGSSGPSRFGGGTRQNSPQGGQRQNGNRPGPSGGQRGGGRPQGQQRGPGRKRGR